MDCAPGRPHRRVGHVFGEHLLRGVNQDVGVLRPEGEVQIEPGERVLELADSLATPVAPGDAQRMQERQFDRSVLGEQGRGVFAVRDGGEKIEQQGLGVFPWWLFGTGLSLQFSRNRPAHALGRIY